MIQCRDCGEVKSDTDFPWRSNRQKYDTLCHKCHYQRQKYRRTSRKYYPEHERAKRLERNYGITVTEYERMYAEQGGRCNICGTDNPGEASFCVDHSHVTGEVRGLLCKSCNTGLGYFKDNPIFLERAAGYLRKQLIRGGR